MNDNESLKAQKDKTLHLCRSYFTGLETSEPVSTLNYLLNSFLEEQGHDISFAEGKKITMEITNLTTLIVELSESIRETRKMELSLIDQSQKN